MLFCNKEEAAKCYIQTVPMLLFTFALKQMQKDGDSSV